MAAAYPVLTYRYRHFLFEVNPNAHPDWRGTEEFWLHHGVEIQPMPAWRVDGDAVPSLPAGVQRRERPAWNRDAIRATLMQHIGSRVDRAPGSVAILLTETGAVQFDGVGMLGRSLSVEEAVTLTVEALTADVSDILLPVEELQPAITLLSEELSDGGIREVVAIGESNFAGSTQDRRHNIDVGLSKFDGHIIPRGETFSFNEVLGPVNRATGFRQELVILGDKTLPDYGGGLCQVSTTAYRGVWEQGFPIAQRRNHSFAVQYYSPQGTDATIYPPYTDMKFVNDGPGDLLIQTHMEGDYAYFIYYGTKDGRSTELVGPYTWGRIPAPPERTEYTTDIPPGTTRKVGSPVPGLKAAWFRIVSHPDAEDPVQEGYYSSYEARPLYFQVGVESEDIPPDLAPAEAPSWIPVAD
ncbi:MAG: VanW family protein [Candidatus Peribacteraceae bacterium]|nr:VanW family protein [Candidatus Peribacteraceae bacterium]